MKQKTGFIEELKRRNVIRMAVLYVVGAWLVVQVVDTLLPMFGAPDWVSRSAVVLLAIGFVPALVFAWVFELTPDGLERDADVPAHRSIAPQTAKRMNRTIVVVLVLALGYFGVDKFLLAPERNAALVESTRQQVKQDAAASAAKISEKSIAVLPFENLSDDKDGEYFVVGMQDEILTRLANIGDLKVVSRTSTEKYRSHAENLREVGKELGVANVVEGSVQRAGDKVRITVQLIDAQSDTHLWAQSYDREMRDVFAVQSDVAGRIASALQLTLQPEETQALAQVPTTDPVAYDLFLRAEYLANRGGVNLDAAILKQSLEHYQQAIARDSSFALALARLSYAQSLLVWIGLEGIDADALTAQARANAERALALNPKLADGYIAQGFSDYYGREDYDAALAAFATAQRLRPNDAGAMSAAGYVYRRQGRLADSIRKLEEALDHDPRNSRIVANLASNYMVMRRYADAEHAFRRALTLDPDNVTAQLMLSYAILSRTGDAGRALTVLRGDHPFVKLQRVYMMRMQRRYADAIAVLESIPDTPDVFGGVLGSSKAASLGQLYQGMGDTARAHHYFVQAEESERQTLAGAEAGRDAKMLISTLLNLADIELGLGHTEAALQQTRRAQATGDGHKDEYLRVQWNWASADLYGRAGRADLAVSLLDRVLASPIGGMAYSPALLPIDPSWDPIRSDPRFVALSKKYPPSIVQEQGAGQRGSSIPIR